MLTYWTQFVYLILVESLSSVVNLSLTAKGQSKISSIASDYYKTAEVSCSILLIVTFLIIGVSNDKFRSLFGIDDKYGPVMILSYVILVCMGIVFIISKDLIYEEKSKQSLIISISYNAIVVIIAILAGYITDDEITGLVIIGGVNIAYTIVLLLWRNYKLRASRIQLYIFTQMKYTVTILFKNVNCMLIYLVALSKLDMRNGLMYLATLSITTLSVDICWDVNGCLGDYYTLITKDNTVDNTKLVLRKSIPTMVIMAIVCLVLNTILTGGFSISWLLAIEIISMYLYLVANVYYTNLLVSGDVSYANYTGIARTILRTILTILIISPYSSELSLIVCGILYYISVKIRYTKRKVTNNPSNKIDIPNIA